MGTEGRLVKNTWIHRHTVVNEEASDNVRRITAPSLGFKLLYLLHELLPRASPQYKGIAARLCPKAFVDDGATLKRFQPRAQGRAFQILKRTSHITVVLSTPTDAHVEQASKKAGKK